MPYCGGFLVLSCHVLSCPSLDGGEGNTQYSSAHQNAPRPRADGEKFSMICKSKPSCWTREGIVRFDRPASHTAAASSALDVSSKGRAVFSSSLLQRSSPFFNITLRTWVRMNWPRIWVATMPAEDSNPVAQPSLHLHQNKDGVFDAPT